jgi:hypothetical protein
MRLLQNTIDALYQGEACSGILKYLNMVYFHHMTDTLPKSEEHEVLLSWFSPSRLFKRRDKDYFKNIGAIVFFLSIIFFFMKEFLLIVAILSVVFLVYALSTVPPENVKHKITNLGIESADHFYPWDSLVDFWFEEQWGQTMLMIRPQIGVRITILLGDQHKDHVRDLVAKYIPFREKPMKSWVDNAAHWLTEKVPLEKASS